LKRGRQSYACHGCNHRWREHARRKPDYGCYYEQWVFDRRTLHEIASDLKISVPTLQKKFDALPPVSSTKPPPDSSVNLVIDATFFGREYGYLCFHDTHRIVHFREIKTESASALDAGLDALIAAGYRFKSFTLDGKRGFMPRLKSRFPSIPVQMCVFHQKAIIRRYITDRPKTACGQELKALMTRFGKDNPQEWIDDLFALQEKYNAFLAEKNERGEYVHRRLRSAFRSLENHLPHLFLYAEIPGENIPRTTNHLEGGTFSHLKEKLLHHRGLNKKRKKKAIEFILYRT